MTLIVTLAAMSLVTMMAVLLFTMVRDDMAIAGNYRRHVVAKQAARSGLNHFKSLNLHYHNIVDQGGEGREIEIIPLTKDDFGDDIDEKDVLYINPLQSGENEFYLNMDNVFISSYIKNLKESEIELAKEQYKLSAAMLGLVLIDQYNEKFGGDSTDETPPTLSEYSKDYTRSFAPLYMTFIRDISDIIDG